MFVNLRLSQSLHLSQNLRFSKLVLFPKNLLRFSKNLLRIKNVFCTLFYNYVLHIVCLILQPDSPYERNYCRTVPTVPVNLWLVLRSNKKIFGNIRPWDKPSKLHFIQGMFLPRGVSSKGGIIYEERILGEQIFWDTEGGYIH